MAWCCDPGVTCVKKIRGRWRVVLVLLLAGALGLAFCQLRRSCRRGRSVECEASHGHGTPSEREPGGIPRLDEPPPAPPPWDEPGSRAVEPGGSRTSREVLPSHVGGLVTEEGTSRGIPGVRVTASARWGRRFGAPEQVVGAGTTDDRGDTQFASLKTGRFRRLVRAVSRCACGFERTALHRPSPIWTRQQLQALARWSGQCRLGSAGPRRWRVGY